MTSRAGLGGFLSKSTPVERRNLSVAAGLGLVLAVLVGRQFVGGPAAAAGGARRSVVPAVVPSDPRAAPFVGSAVLQWATGERPTVDRNLFFLDSKAYPVAPAVNPESSEKSDGLPADQKKQRQDRAAELAKLKLETTVLGLTPKAVIDGELFREGDTIAGFLIVRIEARRVVVARDGDVLEIAMN